MPQIISVVVGGVVGLYWEYVATKPYGRHRTLVESVYLGVGRNSVHVHHWLFYILLIVGIILWAFYRGKLGHPAVTLMLSALVFAISYNFVHYNDEWVFWLKR